MSEITISLKRASEITGLSKKVITQKIKLGEIKATKPGKVVLVFIKSLNDFLKRYEIDSRDAS